MCPLPPISVSLIKSFNIHSVFFYCTKMQAYFPFWYFYAIHVTDILLEFQRLEFWSSRDLHHFIMQKQEWPRLVWRNGCSLELMSMSPLPQISEILARFPFYSWNVSLVRTQRRKIRDNKTHFESSRCTYYPGGLGRGETRLFTCSRPIVGRYVYVRIFAWDWLTLCEVQVYAYKQGRKISHVSNFNHFNAFPCLLDNKCLLACSWSDLLTQHSRNNWFFHVLEGTAHFSC